MHLQPHEIDAYLALAIPRLGADERAQRSERLQQRVSAGEYPLANTLVARESDGLLVALRVASVGGTLYSFVGPFGDPTHASQLVAPALRRAQELGATGVSARPRADDALAAYSDALVAAGFERLGVRIEFETPVASLPNDDGTPFTWESMSETGRDLAAQLYRECATGYAQGMSPDDDPREILDSYLADEKLTTGDDCVAIGYLDGEPVAFVCAQVAPSDGWSRITHMGLIPSARGHGLGKWLHRRGFEMMRAQGGQLYHGGTAAVNTGMVRLFVDHGCEEIARLVGHEWRPS